MYKRTLKASAIVILLLFAFEKKMPFEYLTTMSFFYISSFAMIEKINSVKNVNADCNYLSLSRLDSK